MPELVLTRTLGNGLRLVLAPDAQAQTVALGFFVNTGARDEAPAQLGASHFLEHLMFKGSDALSAAELNERLDSLGGHVNAFTGEEVTVYHAAALPERAPELLATLAELMRPALREEDVEVERGVILEEIAMYADDPASRVFDLARAAYWDGHPLGQLVLGTPDTVGALRAADLRAALGTRYGTARTLLVASGALDATALAAQAEALTAHWPRGGFTRAHPPHHPQARELRVQDARLGRTQFALIAPGVSVTDARREAAAVLAEVVGGENGRLYWSLIEPGLADSADLTHNDFDETGSFEGGWSCDPERAAGSLRVVRALLDDLQGRGVTAAEVARAQRKLAVATLLREETPYGRLFDLGETALSFGEPLTVEAQVARLRGVTPEEVNALLAARPFDRATLAQLGP